MANEELQQETPLPAPARLDHPFLCTEEVRSCDECTLGLTRQTCPMARTIGKALEKVEEHRHVTCPRYDECLGVACEQKWPGWSCAGCPLWVRDEDEAENE